jgi:hypothetical protein
MKKKFVGSLLSFFASTGLALAQAPAPAPSTSTMTQPRAVSAPGGASEAFRTGTDDIPRSDTFALPGVDHGCSHGLEPHWPAVVEPCSQFWANAEYLLWWVKSGPVNTQLVTTGSLADQFPGALGQPNTRVLFGTDNRFDYEDTSGARFSIGYWFDRQGSVGIEGTGFVMEQRSSHNRFSSNGSGSPPIGTSFFNTAMGREDWNDLAAPLLFVGYSDVTSTTQLYGGEANIVVNLYRSECWNIDLLGGFRYVGLDESVTISDATTSAPGVFVFYNNTALPPPAITAVNDSFRTHNHFYGGQAGARVDYKFGNTFVQVTGKIAMGDMNEEVDVSGTSALLVGPVGPVSTIARGIFANAANQGRQEKDTFAVIPEVEVKLGYQFTPHLSANVGYTFMYISDVARPGQQIDHFVNPNTTPTFAEFNQPGGGAFPRSIFNSTDYWAHGLSFGMEVKY